MRCIHALAVLLGASGLSAQLSFEVVDVDQKVAIGYGVAVAEVNGDGKPDIVLVDRHEIVWYENPAWTRHVIARRLTRLDHVCIAARDIDGDGKVELAAGAGWNPGDTEKSGSVHVLVPPADRTQAWRPVQLEHEPTVHRMRWVRTASGFGLVVVPLHGRGNRAGKGKGVRILLYNQPEKDGDPWRTALIDDALHVTHNLDPVQWDDDQEEELLVAGREGLFLFDRGEKGWTKTELVAGGGRGAGEVRAGRLADGQRFLVAVEPFHGNEVAVYEPQEKGGYRRTLLGSDFAQAHALACADLRGTGSDQVVVGWREKNAAGKVGIRLYTRGADGWTVQPVDDDGMACEDLRVADLDGDGRLDVVAAGRATRNLRIYFNRSPQTKR